MRFSTPWLILPMLAVSAVSAPAAPTNLLVIMSDDQGAWSVGCYGNPEARTPAVDRLAAEGVRLTSAFAVTPVCSPSRATFFTGRIPSQHGIHDWIKNENMGPRARYCLDREVQIADVLSGYGYTCGLAGKWHLGDSLNPHAGYTWWYALPQGGSAYNDAEMCSGGQVVPTRGYLTDRITDNAVAFLKANAGRPFFLNVQYNAPHSPWTGHPAELVEAFANCPFDSIPRVPQHPHASSNIQNIGKRAALEQYFASCSGIDRGVGRLMETLDELGLAANTLVVYTSDQGYCFGHHGLVGKGNGTNPRNMYDTSMHVPMIFRHKGTLPAGKTSDVLLAAYDFAPTLLDHISMPGLTGRNLPGRSAADALTGEPPADWPDATFGEYGHTRSIRTRTHKYVHRADGGHLELYDLVKDPDETTNLADDPDHREELRGLRKRLFAWFEQYGEAGADPVGQEYLRPDQQ